MISEEGAWVPFHIVACNSEESNTEIDLLATAKSVSNKSWESASSGSFPIEIILRFHYRTELGHVLICTK